MRIVPVALACLLALGLPCLAEEVDLEVVHRIRREALERSEIMNHVFHLVDVNGPRITGSPGFQGAADWAVKQLNDWGLANAHQEKWGPFGVGWSREYFSAHLVEPGYEMLIGVPLGWSPSTDGVVRGSPLLTPLTRYPLDDRDEASIDKFIGEHRGKLRGKILMIKELQDVEPIAEPPLKRLSGGDLDDRSTALEPIEPIDFSDPALELPEDPKKRSAFLRQEPRWHSKIRREKSLKIQAKLNRFLTAEGVALVIHPAAHGDGGTVFPPRSGDRDPEFAAPPPSIALTPEQYNRIYRLVEKGAEPKIEAEVKTTFHRDNLDSLNVIAEIPGGSKKDEVVMIGGHLDSTEAALGATDNAAGCAVMMEVMRILKKLDLPLDRTVRLGLWGGEEQGLLGSLGYVTEHFADPHTMRVTSEHGRLSAYYNVDNGTGKIRGVYLQGNDMARPIFEAWLKPFHDLGAKTLTIRDTSGTDHLSFDAVGLPGFQFIQDPVEYDTRTHHSNMDHADRIQPGDLMQAAAIVAAFVYHTANRAEKMPRKPLPEPWPAASRE